MSLRSRMKTIPLQLIPKADWARQRPTYADAQPAVIDAALRRAENRPSGNWYVFGASTDIGTHRPFGTRVGGIDIVAWRDQQRQLHVGPAICPHLGADLATGKIDCGSLICPWHGLRLDGGREFGWKPLPTFDDGVLAWVRLDTVGGEPALDAPVIPARPTGARLAAVARAEGVCEPSDIIANRLDPWHGAWFHPYSFTQLEVLSAPPVDAGEDADRFQVAVTFRMGRFGVPVIAEFTAPEPRTIVMRIVDGEGAGSVVETHATPMGPGPDGRPRTAVIEAVVAQSDRTGFHRSLRVAPLITPLVRLAAARLWRDDLAYAERRFALRDKASG
ncbi:Rieske (2Fe-2S) iron-sulfur domain protein [uncultured Mycobacterium sp.]|uniref:Rieske (2Fe-2S) iron-sulfur domain protein n=1 Tax=uncultured Mycobacterium sp. TaxID=171292 RepID=A0A1Y5PK98_9MYCO|nr:Rieske (2Fe-2S) iron-sulfur domain protein [uncultured Mycobacterium sp.]SBS76427.1 Rieske (2Fe-2S) iron-sulfur domain protein [uncultured Mycobacterium sp.]